MELIALKNFGRNRKGRSFHANARDAKWLKQMGIAKDVQSARAEPIVEKAKPMPRQTYQRRDMVAQSLPPVAAPDPFDHDHNGSPGGSTAAEPSDDLAALRAEYLIKVGKRVFPGWDAETIRARMAAHLAGGA